MLRVYADQAAVVKNYRRYLGQLNGELKDGSKIDAPLMQRFIEALENRNHDAAQAGRSEVRHGKLPQGHIDSRVQRAQSWLNDTIDHVDFLLEAIEDRKRELLDLQESALGTQLQVCFIFGQFRP